jgi:hypothetical protein
MYIGIFALLCATLSIGSDCRRRIILILLRKLVLPERIELSTSPLPRACNDNKIKD